MPLPSMNSPAVNDLGLGDMLSSQVKDETEEERKKRMREMQERQLMGPGGSLATMSLFGTGGMGGYPR
jgi:anthranilate phosphoribosyltransferase